MNITMRLLLALGIHVTFLLEAALELDPEKQN